MQLINDDCLQAMRAMPDNSVDAIVTDPPYGILNHKIETDIDIPAFFAECERVMKKDSMIVYFGQQPTLTKWNAAAFEHFTYKNKIIWYKRALSNPFLDMKRVYENIMILDKGNRKYNEIRRSFTDVKQSLAEFVKADSVLRYFSMMKELFSNRATFEQASRYIHDMDASGLKTITHKKNKDSIMGSGTELYPQKTMQAKTVCLGYTPQNLISFMSHNKMKNDMSGNGGGDHNVKHPTVKPIQLMEYLIDLCTNEGMTVLDPFMGSGTTGIACKNLKRDFIGIELDAGYYDIAKARIEKHVPDAKQLTITDLAC